MRKLLIVLLAGLVLIPALHAEDLRLGVGAFGGANIPVVMDDQANGSVFGVKARVQLFPLLVFEPQMTFGKWGAPEAVEGIDLGIDGSKIASYGIDITIGNLAGQEGIKPYFMGGIGIYSIKNDDTDYDESKMGFAGGLGLAYGFSPIIDLDIRGKVMIAPQEEGSKKAVFITAGLNYYFGMGN